MSTTFDSKTIVMMAENGHSVEIDGKRIQMTIVSKAKPHPNALTIDELEDGKSYLLAKKDGYMKNGSKFCTKGFYYLAVSSFMYFASEYVSEGETDHVLTDEKFIEEHFTKYIHKSEAKPDYSHLVGKWVKYVGQEGVFFTKNKWYQVETANDGQPMFMNDKCIIDGLGRIMTEYAFDLSNPLDHNPDDVRVFDVPSEIKISKGAYGLRLHFNEDQVLWYSKEKHCYSVIADGCHRSPIPCIATECKFEDLKEGDLFFVTDEENPDFNRLFAYRFLDNKNQFICVYKEDVRVFEVFTFNHYFKITPKP